MTQQEMFERLKVEKDGHWHKWGAGTPTQRYFTCTVCEEAKTPYNQNPDLTSDAGKTWIEKALLRRGESIFYAPVNSVEPGTYKVECTIMGFKDFEATAPTLSQACYNATVKYLKGVEG